MKYAILADTHFGVRDLDTIASNMERFYVEVFFPYLLSNNIKKIIHVGDLFDRRRNVDVIMLDKSITYFFEKLVEYDIEMDLVIGNHDTYYKSTNDVNLPAVLKREFNSFKNINIFSEYHEREDENFAYIPWINRSNKVETMKKVKASTKRFAFGHLELQGFQMYANQVCMHGDEASDFTNSYKRVFTGHFHHRSPSKRGIYYLGSPSQYNWADCDDVRGFHVFDSESEKITFIENPLNLFVKLDYDNKQSFDQPSDYVGKYVKIISRKGADPIALRAYADQVEKTGALTVTVDNATVDLLTDVEYDDSVESTPQLITKYVEAFNVTNKVQVASYMNDLYSQAINL